MSKEWQWNGAIGATTRKYYTKWCFPYNVNKRGEIDNLKNFQKLIHFVVCDIRSIPMYKYHQTSRFSECQTCWEYQTCLESNTTNPTQKYLIQGKIILHHVLLRGGIIGTLKIIQNCFQTNLSASSLMGWTKILQWCQKYDNRWRESMGGMWRPICVMFSYTEMIVFRCLIWLPP